MKYNSAITKRREAESDLNDQLQNQTAPDMKVKQRECRDTEEQLKRVETKLGNAVSLHTPLGWRTFLYLWLTGGDHLVGKVSAMGQPTRTAQPSIPSGSVNN